MKYSIIAFMILFQGLNANAQLVNGDFENIETINVPGTNDTYERPVNWCFGYPNPYGAEITTDSYSGNYAVKLWSWYVMQSNEELHYGNTPYDGGWPISNRPTKLEGFYKFIDPNIQSGNVPDSAYVNILLTKYDPVLSERDTVSLTEYNLGEQNSYSLFEIELNYSNNQIPDSIRIYFRTSYFQGPSDNTGADDCNYLYLDSLSLEYVTTSISEQTQKKIKVYPNPADDMLYIWGKNNLSIQKIQLLDIQGKLVKQYLGNARQLDVADLMSGIYFLQIQTNNGKTTKRVLIE